MKQFEELLEISIFKELYNDIYNLASDMNTYGDRVLEDYKQKLTKNLSVWNIVKTQSWRKAADKSHSPLQKETLRDVVKYLDEFKNKMDVCGIVTGKQYSIHLNF